MKQPENYITTYKKHRFSPLNPSPDNIDIEDIAHALSLMCRANGHFTGFFSIARHCINCCKEGQACGLSPQACLMLLLHDASEAYISDLTRPVKMGLPDYVKIEEHLQNVIWGKFGTTPTASDLKIIGEIDDMMLKLEFEHFADEVIEIDTISPKIPPDFEFVSFEQDERDYLGLFNGLW
ncbi:MAG: phosphohydrolase [Oscillospiraceae bacterium]|nr:phosphohydrolase [Oscillospiraceae bacterium]